MPDIIEIARTQIALLSEDSEKAQAFISNGESFLSEIEDGSFQGAEKPEDIGEFMTQGQHFLQAARDRIESNRQKTQKINEFMRFARALEEEADREISEIAEEEEAPALPPKPQGELKLIRLLKRPAFDWISFLAWVVLLGLALNYWASR